MTAAAKMRPLTDSRSRLILPVMRAYFSLARKALNVDLGLYLPNDLLAKVDTVNGGWA